MSVRLLTTAAALSITLASCGGSGAVESTSEAAVPAAPIDSPTAIDVLAGDSELGAILVGPNGLSLYGFTNDVEASSTCYGTCADAWPPVIVSDEWTAGPGLDFGIFATTVRDDGQTQLVAGRWPLYYFAGDATAGDLKGQGSGDVWFAVDTDGRLIEAGAGEVAVGDEATATDEGAAAEDAGATDAVGSTDESDSSAAPGAVGTVSTDETELGAALVDEDGLTLYGFLNDSEGQPSCNDSCADAWPPLLVGGPDTPAGLDPAVYSVAERADGSFQLLAGVWPLYRFAGDAGPGDVNGQGSGNVWFVAAPDGTLIGAGAGEGSETMQPAAMESGNSSSSGNGYSSGG